MPKGKTRRMRRAAVIGAMIALGSLPGATAGANTSHEGWPKIDMVLMNKTDGARPLDARPGFDPFGGTDRRYSCDAVHLRGTCQRYFQPMPDGSRVVGPHKIHSELLGGHGNDKLTAGAYGDVLWGDYKPSGQPSTQHDEINGGDGADVIYASHGENRITAGGGDDYVKAHYGHGVIDCGGGSDTLYVSRDAQKGYKISHCEHVSHKTLGF